MKQFINEHLGECIIILVEGFFALVGLVYLIMLWYEISQNKEEKQIDEV